MDPFSKTSIVYNWNEATYHKLCAISKEWSWKCATNISELAYVIYVGSILYIHNLLKISDSYRYPEENDYYDICSHWKCLYDDVTSKMKIIDPQSNDFEFMFNAYVEGVLYAMDKISNVCE